MVQKTIYFHIGTVKTGSSYLQKTMWENRGALEEEGATYLTVMPPALHLPRYANADFLDDPTLHDAARRLIEDAPCDRIIISEEGLFGRPQLMLSPLFDGFRKEVLVYVRRPAELVASWAAEIIAPYNAVSSGFPWQSGLMEFDLALVMASNAYAACMGRCFSVFSRGDFAGINVRPFEKAQLVRGDLLDDFLAHVGVDSVSFRRRAETDLLNSVNQTRSRKFYDVSYLTWKYLQDQGRSEAFSLDLVERVLADCQSGDDRPPIETIDDEVIDAISLELGFVEDDLALHGLAPEPFFRERLPPIYGTPRVPLQPVLIEEVERLTQAATQPPQRAGEYPEHGGEIMPSRTFEELQDEHEKIVLGLQFTIAQRERLKALMHLIGRVINEENANTISKIAQELLNSPAQHLQDIFALLLNGGKRDGFFVEFGACDGLRISNTVLLEREFGWRGILAEPDTSWHERLRANRSARVDTRCVSSVTGAKIEFYHSSYPENSSSDRSQIQIGNILDSYLVDTVSLLDLLRAHEAPKFIDFLSVDVEGHEMEVLKSFDFNEFKFGFICIEQRENVALGNSVQPILEAAGYKVILPRHEGRPLPMQITGIDLFFVPKDHPFADLTWPRY